MNKKIEIVAGLDLVSWADSVRRKIEITQYNKEIFLGALAIGGAVIGGIAGAKGNFSTSITGLSLYSVGSGALVISEINKELNKIESTKLFPREHLYTSFSLPPELFTRKWILLYSKDGIFPEKIYLNIVNHKEKSARFKLIVWPAHGTYNNSNINAYSK